MSFALEAMKLPLQKPGFKETQQNNKFLSAHIDQQPILKF